MTFKWIRRSIKNKVLDSLDDLKSKMLQKQTISNILLFIVVILSMIVVTIADSDKNKRVLDDKVTVTTVLPNNLKSKNKIDIFNKDTNKDANNDAKNYEEDKDNDNDKDNEISIKKEIEKETEKETETETKIDNKITKTVNKEKSNSEVYEIININSSTKDILTKLPGIGDTLAERIVDYRNANGNYKSINELLNVSGIGNAKFKKIKKYIEI